jgi:magnesium chelatase family protein
LRDHEFVGELALTGELRPIRGALAVALQTRATNRALVLPDSNVGEALLVDNVAVRGAAHLLDVSAHLNGSRNLPDPPVAATTVSSPVAPDLSEVKGQSQAKRALEIAAAGGHSLLYIGPPGSGKSMLAARLPGLLPPMSDDEALEAAAIHSLYNGFALAHWKQRPYRAPHHTASGVALVGGGCDFHLKNRPNI